MQMLLAQMSLGSLVLIVTRPPTMTSQLKAGGAEGLSGVEENEYAGLLEEDDRIKFSRILKGLKDADSVTLLALGPLDDEATKELVGASFATTSDKVGETLYSAVAERAGGVPMYVRTFSKWLEEKKMIVRTDDG